MCLLSLSAVLIDVIDIGIRRRRGDYPTVNNVRPSPPAAAAAAALNKGGATTTAAVCYCCCSLLASDVGCVCVCVWTWEADNNRTPIADAGYMRRGRFFGFVTGLSYYVSIAVREGERVG